MKSLCFYFQVHQPYRVKRFRVFDIGNDAEYFNHRGEGDLNNRAICEKVARKSYIPATQLLIKLLRKHPDFRVSFSFSGVALEQSMARRQACRQLGCRRRTPLTHRIRTVTTVSPVPMARCQVRQLRTNMVRTCGPETSMHLAKSSTTQHRRVVGAQRRVKAGRAWATRLKSGRCRKQPLITRTP